MNAFTSDQNATLERLEAQTQNLMRVAVALQVAVQDVRAILGPSKSYSNATTSAVSANNAGADFMGGKYEEPSHTTNASSASAAGSNFMGNSGTGSYGGYSHHRKNVGDLIVEIFMKNPGLRYSRIAELVREQVPDAKTSEKSVASTIKHARKEGRVPRT